MVITVRVAQSKKCFEDYSCFVSFPYDNRLVEVMRSFPNRYWDKDNKEWEIPLSKLESLVEQVPEAKFNIRGSYVELTKPEDNSSPEFEFKTKPFDHQVEGFKFGLSHDRWLLGDEQGLGKTKQVIDIAVAKQAEGFQHCLIVCGVNGLKWNWLNEVHTHSQENGWILGQRYKAGKVLIGSNADKLADVKQLGEETCSEQLQQSYFIITNVETLRVPEIAEELNKKCQTGIIGLVAIDEIHKCKNPSSQQGKGILKLQSKYKIAMTGTPLMNNPFDLYIILKWLGYEKHSFYAFQRHYGVFGGFGGYEVLGYRYLNELQEQLDSVMLRRLKKDVLDLPEKTYISEYVEMTPKQSRIYSEIKADIQAHIDQIQMSNNPLAELIRMRQATGYTGILSSVVKESAKLDRMEELVEEAVSNGKKVVIFSNWTQMTDIIKDRLQKYSPALITGQVTDAIRQSQVDRFQNDNDCKVIIGTTGAMGTGLTLTAGTVEIFLDEPWNKALKDQAEDRCHRVGTKENVTIYTLLCKGTIDERIHDLVERKGALADALVDGQIKTTNSELLSYLIG